MLLLSPKTQRIMVGQKIKKIRLYKNLTQEHMAERLGVSLKTYNKMEGGAAPVSIDRLNKAAEEFGMKPEDILTLKDDNATFSNTVHEAKRDGIVINNQISSAEKEALESRIRTLEEQVKLLQENDRFQKGLITKLMAEKG